MKNQSTPHNLEVQAGGPDRAPEANTSQNVIRSESSLRPTTQFQEVPIGQFFEYRGRRYKKLAPNLASDEDRNGTIFMYQTEVLPDPFARISQIPEPKNCLNPSL